MKGKLAGVDTGGSRPGDRHCSITISTAVPTKRIYSHLIIESLVADYKKLDSSQTHSLTSGDDGRILVALPGRPTTPPRCTLPSPTDVDENLEDRDDNCIDAGRGLPL